MKETSLAVIPQAFEKAVTAVNGDGAESRLAKAFAKALFGQIGADALSMHSPDDLAKLALSAFSFFETRPKGEPKLRAYNFEQGSAGPLTVVETLNDDMPFLLSSVLNEIIGRGLTIRLVTHPIICTQRDATGKAIEFFGPDRRPPAGARTESFFHVEVDRLEDEADREELLAALKQILGKVGTVVADHQAMLARLNEAIAAYTAAPPPVAVDELAESIQFLRWIASGHFTLLGMRNYDFIREGSERRLEPRPGSDLGLLRDPNLRVLRQGGSPREMSPELEQYFTAPAPLIIAKANFLSPVHRRIHVDSIGVKLYSPEGTLTGELRVVGLFASRAYTESIERIPFLRHKVEQVFRRSGNAVNSYSGRVLRNILETFPRDELFQISTDQLAAISEQIVQLELMPHTRVFVRYDEFRRFASVLVFVLRERFSTEIGDRICAAMAEDFQGHVSEFTPVFTIGPLVRVQVVIWKDEGAVPVLPVEQLEAEIEKIVRTWQDELRDALRRHYGNSARPMLQKYVEAFPAGYEEVNRPSRAIEDIARLEKLSPANPIGIDFFRDDSVAEPSQLRAMIYQLDAPISLSRRVPILENFGFSVTAERTSELTVQRPDGPRTVFLHDMMLRTSAGKPIDLPAHDLRLEAAFLAVWRGEAGNDAFNGLIVQAGLDWREAALLRAYGTYLRQIGSPFGFIYVATALDRHGAIVRNLVQMFHVMFDPARGLGPEQRQDEAARLSAAIEQQLEQVSSLDEDRVVRRFRNLIQATIRTNYYQAPAELTPASAIAFKIDSARVDGMPSPKPFAEIFVTSPRFDGVHLRGGPIARGGLRWSDRLMDFRTEVLGLAKAQQVKNAIIVPQGAKGGFVPKHLSPGMPREEMMAEGIACYRSFIANLLSVTDNLKDGAVAPPARVVRLDRDDPYLVVAADKGTATFSDIANALAIEHDFWLGDAFASGGSAGYDHKKMAITARGAWEAVKRHFRETNIDIQTTPFRVAGVGDMSGDVFGNGMLLSRQIRLVAAFDHRDIFIDPDPDSEASFAERQRLFDLPRSSWQDYDQAKISKGGGVFSRSAKSIPLSDEIRSLLGTSALKATPAELMRLILKAGVDLLWFGGIGTYIRSSAESDEQAGDRANDAIRITAAEVGARVIGEGANLGVTQRGRIEFALKGGRLNTDAIDNSAGVNSSDVEVNIKIALGAAVRSGKITLDERNAILVAMTSEVAHAVLRNNYLQTLAISMGERRGLADLGFQSRLMQMLELRGLLDRGIEALPSDLDLAERRQQRQPLTRPELAALLAYAKIGLYHDLIGSGVPDDPYLSRVLADYFPETMRGRFTAEIATHRLRREIIATMLANATINRGGSTFVVRLAEETGREAGEIAYAYATAMGVFNLAALLAEIDTLDNKVDGEWQLRLYLLIQDVIRRQTAWFLRHGRFQDGLSSVIERYRHGLGMIAAQLDVFQDERQRSQTAAAIEDFASHGVPADLARRIATVAALSAAPDIVSLAEKLKRPEVDVGRLYFQIGAELRLDELRLASEKLGQTDHFNRLAVNSTLESIAAAQRALAAKVYTLADGGAPDFEAWRERHQAAFNRAQKSLDEILGGGELTLAKLTVAVAHLRDLAQQE
jgi:glutamate dehydrogenase